MPQVPSEQRALAKLWEVAERNREFGAGDPEPQSVRLMRLLPVTTPLLVAADSSCFCSAQHELFLKM